MSLPKFAQTYTVSTPAQPVKFILDNDLGGDCDDAGDLALTHGLWTAGECELVGMVNVRNVQNAVVACDAINTYYGRGTVLIGANKNYAGIATADVYATTLAAMTHDLTYAAAPEAVSLYRQLLAAQSSKIKIMVTGACTLLYNLLISEADVNSPLSGSDLVAAKVDEIILVIGRFPRSGWAESNIVYDKVSANYVVENCPVTLTMCGCEMGDVTKAGAGLTGAVPETNPIRVAYEAVVGQNTAQCAWAQVGIIYMCRGTSDYFLLVNGTASVDAVTALSTFAYSAGGAHRLLCLKYNQIGALQTLINGYLEAMPA